MTPNDLALTQQQHKVAMLRSRQICAELVRSLLNDPPIPPQPVEPREPRVRRRDDRL